MSLRTTLLNCLTALACIALLLVYAHKYMRYQIVGNDSAVFVLDRQTTLMHHCDKDHCQLITPQGTTIETMRQLAGIPSPQNLIQLQNKKKEQQSCCCDTPKEDLFPNVKMQITSFQTIEQQVLSSQKLQQQQKDMAEKINMPVMMEPKNPQQPFPSDVSFIQTGGYRPNTSLQSEISKEQTPSNGSGSSTYSNSIPSSGTSSMNSIYGNNSSSSNISSTPGIYGDTQEQPSYGATSNNSYESIRTLSSTPVMDNTYATTTPSMPNQSSSNGIYESSAAPSSSMPITNDTYATTTPSMPDQSSPNGIYESGTSSSSNSSSVSGSYSNNISSSLNNNTATQTPSMAGNSYSSNNV